jgi:5-formyltetrahydrofolate cyclo-ligase
MTAPLAKTTKRLSASEILEVLSFSEQPDTLTLEQLSADEGAQVVAAMLSGYKLILRHWPEAKPTHASVPTGHPLPAVDLRIKAEHVFKAEKGRAASNGVGESV